MSESNPLGRKPFLSMIMIISEKFHVDPESLKPWVERGQKVTLTVNNAKHDSSQTFHFFKLVKGPAKVFFSNFWTLRFRNGCFRLVELDLFEFVILSVWETIVEQIRFTWNSLLSCVNTGATFSPKLYDFQQK